MRLACIRHVASVHPEPGSNSSLIVDACLPTRGQTRLDALTIDTLLSWKGADEEQKTSATVVALVDGGGAAERLRYHRLEDYCVSRLAPSFPSTS